MTGTLQTPHFTLRPLQAADEETYVALYTDAEVMRHIGPPQDTERARRDFRATLRAVSTPGSRKHFWMLVEPGATQGVGLIGIVGDAAGACDLGIVMFADRQGRSYAAHALAAVADHAFRERSLVLIRTRHTVGNRRTEGLMHKLGYLPDSPDPASGDLRWRLTAQHWQRVRAAWRGD